VALPALCLASEPGYVWTVRAGGARHDKARGLCTDRAGNVYLTGEFSETADFGKEKLTSRGDYDFFVAKYSPKGECLWARQGGGTKTDRGYGVAVDEQGGVFVTGHYQSSDALFGSEYSLPLRGDYDVFTAKYDPSGKLLWIRTAGGERYDYGHGIGVDGAGNCYVTGGVVGNTTYGDKAVENPTGSHLFLVKYSPTGDLVWARESRGNSASGQGLAVDRAGNSWAAGGTTGPVDFGGVSLNGSGADLLLVKYDPEGKALWAAGGGGDSSGVAVGVSIDRQGNAYVGGMLKGTATIGSTTFTSHGEYDMLAAKFDLQGKPVWAHTGGGPKTDYCLGIAADPKGGCYAVGEIAGSTMFEGQSVVSAGGQDLYVAHYDAAGKPVSIRNGGAEKDDLCYCIALDGKEHAYLSGAFNGTTKYGSTAPITSIGGNDIFLTKVRLGDK
jgi:hypothetical protein